MPELVILVNYIVYVAVNKQLNTYICLTIKLVELVSIYVKPFGCSCSLVIVVQLQIQPQSLNSYNSYNFVIHRKRLFTNTLDFKSCH